MRNIAGISKKYIDRTYDLKGSTHNRTESKKKKNLNKDPSSFTLKDLDFKEYENNIIYIPKNESICCSRILTSDALFLKKMKIMDYSLIVMKVNYKRYFNDLNKRFEEGKIYERFQRNNHCIECKSEKGVYYQIGIIDYF